MGSDAGSPILKQRDRMHRMRSLVPGYEAGIWSGYGHERLIQELIIFILKDGRSLIVLLQARGTLCPRCRSLPSS